jgi:hypothetical protein
MNSKFKLSLINNTLMKFKIKRADRPKHTELVACVGWSRLSDSPGGELYSVGDDQAIWEWDINGEPVSLTFRFNFDILG